MEFFLRFLLITVKLVALYAKLLSFLWQRIFPQPVASRLPAIQNRLLTYSVQELRARLRARQVRARRRLISWPIRLRFVYICIYYS